MASTSKDVARVAGVSQSTVSYVLTGKRPISAKTTARVQAAMESLGFQPNAGARALAGRRSRVIGLVIPFRENVVAAAGLLPFIHTIAEAAREHDHEVLLSTVDEGPSGLRRLAGRSLCDAVILMDVRAKDERIPVAASLGLPVVLIGLPEEAHGVPCVDVDFAQAARLSVQELSERGHDRVTLFGYSASTMSTDLNFVRRFVESAQATAEAHKIPLDVIAPVQPDRAGARQAVAAMALGGLGKRHAILIPQAEVVQQILHALPAYGLQPGGDVTVIAHSTDLHASETEPPVSNVSLEPRSVSRKAVETLFGLLDGHTPAPPVTLVPSRLTHRATTMPA